ncbi:MAG: hypothetical protein ACOC0Z_05965 [Halohasta sp.]
MEPRLSRRRLLAACATGATAVLAGCVDPDVAMFVERMANDRAIGEQASVDADRYDDHRSLIANATDADTNTTTEAPSDSSANRPPFEPDRPVAYDGTVYDFDWESTGRVESHTEYAISLAVTDRDPEVAFEDLPEIDRERLDRAPEFFEQVEAEQDDDEDDEDESADAEEQPRFEVQHRYTDAERDASVLVPEPEYEVIGIDGHSVGVDVESRTVDREIYRYEASERASTVAGFGEAIREAHQFELRGLSAAERDFFESVIEEGSYYQGSFGDDDEEAFERFADRIVQEPALFVEGTQGEWLVAYDGDDYWLRIDFVTMAEYADRLEAVDSL